MKKLFSILTILTMILTPTAFAASPWTQHEDYSVKAHAKLGYGVANAVLGWQELITETADSLNSGENIAIGFCRGVLRTLGREIGGIGYIVTYPITALDYPLPEQGRKLWPVFD